jgi:23S rRNA pseudouridine1911/1915/1917 synthase
VARTHDMFDHLKAQFQNQETRKIYHAFVYGRVKDDTGTIDQPIGKSNKDFRQWSASPHARGVKRDAVTDFEVLHRSDEHTYIAFSPKTGRTHQIRVHAKYINHPIVADALYAGKRVKGDNLGFTRQALHAKALSFTTLDGEKVSFEAPLPEDFDNALKTLAIL